MNNWELFQTAYQNASPEVRELLDSDKVPTAVSTILAKRGLSQLQSAVLVQMSLYLLKAQGLDATNNALLQIGIVDSLQFIVEFQNNLNVVTPSAQPPVQVKDSENLQADIIAAEHDLESIHSIRTMAHDMQEAKSHPVTHPTTPEKTYQSSQADLLKQIETMAKPSTAPRWDTES